MYYVFIRTWYKENPKWPNGLEPCPGPETILEKDIETEKEARKIAMTYNATHEAGRYQEKAEFREQ